MDLNERIDQATSAAVAAALESGVSVHDTEKILEIKAAARETVLAEPQPRVVSAVFSAVASASGPLGEAVIRAQQAALEEAFANGVGVHDVERVREIQLAARDQVVAEWRE